MSAPTNKSQRKAEEIRRAQAYYAEISKPKTKSAPTEASKPKPNVAAKKSLELENAKAYFESLQGNGKTPQGVTTKRTPAKQSSRKPKAHDKPAAAATTHDRKKPSPKNYSKRSAAAYPVAAIEYDSEEDEEMEDVVVTEDETSMVPAVMTRSVTNRCDRKPAALVLGGKKTKKKRAPAEVDDELEYVGRASRAAMPNTGLVPVRMHMVVEYGERPIQYVQQHAAVGGKRKKNADDDDEEEVLARYMRNFSLEDVE